MERKKVFLAIFLAIFISKNAVNATKLNYPRVLLPIFDKISINFTLQVIEKGCFKWTSSRQDLILITPIYEDADIECSHQAKVTVLTRERRRNTAIVLAEDVQTGEALRCDVILDLINNLGVHTTTRQLYLEEAPETFELRAEDSQGNAFTTLEGVEFNWVISSLNPESRNYAPALRFLTFTESPYHEVPTALEKFEAQGIKGYMVLLEGINTGTAKVTVSLPYPEYSFVSAIEVYINVLANIILEPSEVHLLNGDTIEFRILQMKMGKLHEISLNKQYFLEAENDKIVTIDGNRATALRLGRTRVVLRDRNVPNDGSFDNSVTESSIPSAQVTVADPVSLGVSLLPHNNWITVEGERHEIAFDLYSRTEQKITLGPLYRIESELDQTLFQIIRRSDNGSRLNGRAARHGKTMIYGSFRDLTTQAELQIFKKLTLEPVKVILPFDPNVVKTQKIQFIATGGDGSYIWHTQNARVLQINQQGLATTIIRDSDRNRKSDTYELGTMLTAHTSVRVALAKNPKIVRQADIFFAPPKKLEILKYNFETALKDFVRLHVAIYAQINGTEVPFSKCENLIFDYEFTNQIFQVDYKEAQAEGEPEIEGACQVVHLRSTAIGLTQLRLSYKFQDKILKDEVTLSVFEKLKILNPVQNEIVLPIGASRNVVYSNGPQRIFTLEAELSKTADYDKNIAQVTEIPFDSPNYIHAFTVLCREVGSTVLDFVVYNTLFTANYKPYISKISTAVHCVKPRFLNLYAMEQLRESCPLEKRSSLLHLKERDDKFEIEIEVQDAKNRKLMNISSLHIDWDFAAGEERFSTDTISYYQDSEVEYLEGVRLPVKDVLVTTIAEVSPNFRIKGVVTHYDAEVLTKNNIFPEEPNFGIKNPKTKKMVTPVIENEIRFMTVNTTLFPSDHISIFMAKNRRERIPMAQGSGFYEFELSEQDVIRIEYAAKERQLLVTPLRIGNVRIEVIDRCLQTEPVYLSISVVSIGTIEAEAPDRVERTKSIEAIVRLYDSNDELLHIDSQNLHIYELSQNILNPDVVSVNLGEQNDLNTGEIRYFITGKNLGETKIVFTSVVGDVVVASEPLNIQVFPPLRLYPRNSTLVVGSSVQIYYHGGPQPDVNIVYQVQDKKVISMESAIVTAYKLGDTKITGKCIMTNPGNGKQMVISEDTIEVHVVPLVSIYIKTPLVRIRSGAVMPAAVWGMPDLSPMVLGTLANMHITWTTNQADVIDIYNVFADAGIEYNDTDLISVRIKALNPGKVKIQAKVELPNGQRLTASVDLVVFKILELESPKHIKMDWILMAPRSTIQLKANLDDVVYKMDNNSNGIFKVSSDGAVQTRDTLGRELVIARAHEQTLPIGIEVKNVQYILASLRYPTVKLKTTEEKIPRGMNFVLKISLHDNLGNEFSHSIQDISDVKYDLSHKDVVDVQIGNNLTLMLNLPRETSNMIAISLRDATGVKHAEDYIKLSVAESKHIYPTKTTIFTVGDIICFDSPLTLSSIWTSSDDQIITIDRFTGVARVLGNRFKLGDKVVVANGDKASGSFMKFDVEVRDADVLEFAKSFDVFNGDQSYRGHLVVRNHLQAQKFTNLIARNISKCLSTIEKIPVKLFKCELKSQQSLGQQVLEHYKVTPIFEGETGRYACQIELKSPFNDVATIVRTNDVLFEMEAQLANGLSDTLSLKLVPGITITPDSFLASNLPKQELTITGLDRVLQKVEVKPSDEKFLRIEPQTKTHGTHQYKIYIRKALPVDEQIFIHVSSPITHQNFEIPIHITSLTEKCSTKPFVSNWNWQDTLSTIGGWCIVAIITFILFYVFLSYGPNAKLLVNRDAFSPSSRGYNDTPMMYRSRGTPDMQSFEQESPEHQGTQQIFVPQSPYYDRGSFSPGSTLINRNAGNEPIVYGDTSLVTPATSYKRLNRRFL